MRSDIERRRSAQPLIIAAGLAVASVLSVAALQAAPHDGAQVAAIFSPWTSSGSALTRVAQADGLLVRRGLIDSIVVVQSDEPGLIARLYAAGAWLVIDPNVFGGCLAGHGDSAR
jgi:hypothetical protein